MEKNKYNIILHLRARDKFSAFNYFLSYLENKFYLHNKVKNIDYLEALNKQKKWLEKVKQDKEELDKIIIKKLAPYFT